ncbi:MAG: hypothetical protein SF052_17890 [Bacteroidia bacterium]|nr:hypothetical protein [Bacteroidia bacterium]
MKKLPGLALAFAMFLYLFPTSGNGQTIRANLEFAEDTLAIGRPVLLRMAIEHPENTVVVFPRDPKLFTPFELITAEAEPTRTVSGVSWDVVNYSLRSFELYPRQSVQLPFIWVSNTDSIKEYILSDTLRLVERIAEVTDELRYKSQEGILLLQDPPNYIFIFGIILGVLSFLLITAFLLRKPIRNYLTLRQIKQEWGGVKRQLRRLEQMQDQAKVLDELNHLWKKYLDPKDTYALLTKTTTELREDIARIPGFSMEQQKTLIQTAMVGDQVIYAGVVIEKTDIMKMITEIRNVLGYAYERKKRKMKEVTA